MLETKLWPGSYYIVSNLNNEFIKMNMLKSQIQEKENHHPTMEVAHEIHVSAARKTL